MRTTRTNVLLALSAVVVLLVPIKSQGQLGGVGDIVKVATGNVTVESLNGDLFGGLDFFAKANIKFAEALQPATNAAAIKARLEAMDPKKDPKAAQAAVKEVWEQNQAAADELIQKGQALSEQQKQLVKEGQTEAAKGVAKWGLVAASLAMAANSGRTDAQLATAIPAAQQVIQDLPSINKMLGTVKKLNKIK